MTHYTFYSRRYIMKKLYNASFTYLIIGLLSGIFAREYGKYKGILGSTLLNLLHTHTLVLGFFFFLIALGLAKVFAFHEAKSFNNAKTLHLSGFFGASTGVESVTIFITLFLMLFSGSNISIVLP